MSKKRRKTTSFTVWCSPQVVAHLADYFTKQGIPPRTRSEVVNRALVLLSARIEHETGSAPPSIEEAQEILNKLGLVGASTQPDTRLDEADFDKTKRRLEEEIADDKEYGLALAALQAATKALPNTFYERINKYEEANGLPLTKKPPNLK